MMFKHINDLLALLLLVLIIPGLWLAQGLGKVNLPGEVTGALIAAYTLVLQFYFRKAPPNSTPAAPTTAAAPITPAAPAPAGGGK